MSNLKSFNVAYDRNSDVLYISARRDPAVRGIEDPVGIVWRYDREGELIGCTIIDYSELWYTRRHELAGRLSEGFHIPVGQVDAILNHAMER
jgi:uncharacterized protein YuzE